MANTAARWSPSNRAFGFVFSGFFLAISAWQLLTQGTTTLYFVSLGAAGCMALASIVAPAYLAPLNRAWMRLGLVMHSIVNPVVLGLMFAVLIIPVGLFFRLIRRDAMHLRTEANADSYWQPRADGKIEPDCFLNQF